MDAKVTYVHSDKSTAWVRYSFSKTLVYDPPLLGPAIGDATNGGQLGNAPGLVQSVGIGVTHTFSPTMLFDWNFGFTNTPHFNNPTASCSANANPASGIEQVCNTGSNNRFGIVTSVVQPEGFFGPDAGNRIVWLGASVTFSRWWIAYACCGMQRALARRVASPAYSLPAQRRSNFL